MSVVPVNVKLLLDENISPKVAEILRRENGIDAVHVRDRGGLGTLDHEVLDLAFGEDRILVTSNVADFVELARARDLHAGIVLLEEGDLLRDEQLAVVRVAVAAIMGHGDMANTLLWIALDGATAFEDVPPSRTS